MEKKAKNQILLGIDLGTTGAKTLAIDAAGEVLATHTESYPLHRPRQGWSEQDPADWWEAVLEAIRRILAEEAVEEEGVKGLALSGQMHGSVFLDSEGEVVRPPLLWNDTRTSPQCREIERLVGEERLYQLVGNPPLEGFTAPKVLWLRENEPENFDKLDTLLLPKDYVVYRLTGKLRTEASDAAGTLLLDVADKSWSEEMCEALDLDTSILPQLLDSVDPVGPIKEEVARRTGLPRETTVVAGGADNACSAVGTGIIEEGLVSSSTGSSGVVLAHKDEMDVDEEGRIHSFNHAMPGKWYLMGVMLSAGLSLRWFKEEFGQLEESLSSLTGLDPYGLLDEEAEGVPPGAEGLLFLPYLGGERTPHRDSKARGVFFGISSSHEKPHFVRAILEGVTFGLRDSLELIKELGVEPKQIRATGGGAKSPLWRRIQADVFGQEVVATAVDEGPAFGAALLAGVGAGVYRDLEEAVEDAVSLDESTMTEPDPERVAIYEEYYPLYRSLYKSLKEDFARDFEIVNK